MVTPFFVPYGIMSMPPYYQTPGCRPYFWTGFGTSASQVFFYLTPFSFANFIPAAFLPSCFSLNLEAIVCVNFFSHCVAFLLSRCSDLSSQPSHSSSSGSTASFFRWCFVQPVWAFPTLEAAVCCPLFHCFGQVFPLYSGSLPLNGFFLYSACGSFPPSYFVYTHCTAHDFPVCFPTSRFCERPFLFFFLLCVPPPTPLLCVVSGSLLFFLM